VNIPPHPDEPGGHQDEPDIDVVLMPRSCTIKPEFFPYTLADLHGTVHYRQHGVELQELRARHERTEISLEKGHVFFNADGGFAVDLVNLQGNPILPDADFIRALPPALSQTCKSLGIKQPLSLRTNLTVNIPAERESPPHIYWDGGVRLKEATLLAGVPFTGVNGVVWSHGEHCGTFGTVQGNLALAQATIFNQTLHDIQSKILVDAKEPDSVLLPNLEAQLHGGDIGGPVRVRFGASVGYEADLTASRMQLEEFSRSNRLGPNAQQSGLVNARLYLKGEGTDPKGLKGWGSIDMPSGKMYNLPLLLDLLKFLSLRLPDRTFFEEAHARFTVDGQRVDISRIDLLGAAISFGGHGTVDLGSRGYSMELYALWGRIVQLSPPFIKDVWPSVSKQLLKIKMKGKIGETPRFERDLVPGLSEPLEKVLERIGGKQGG
jgi:hypothetical protein